MSNFLPSYIGINRADYLLPSYLSFNETNTDVSIISEFQIVFSTESLIFGEAHYSEQVRIHESGVYFYTDVVNNSGKKKKYDRDIDRDDPIQRIATFPIASLERVNSDLDINESIKVISLSSEREMRKPNVFIQRNDDDEIITLLLAAMG